MGQIIRDSMGNTFCIHSLCGPSNFKLSVESLGNSGTASGLSLEFVSDIRNTRLYVCINIGMCVHENRT